MDSVMVFTDGSVDVNSATGYGAFLMLTDRRLSPAEMKHQVKIRRFHPTSPVRLELETLLWALRQIPADKKKIEFYTDSQNIIKLPDRRGRLEQNNYLSKNKRPIKNGDLYREFFSLTDALDCTFIKAEGHQPSGQKDTIHQIFTLVDKASRRALRQEIRTGFMP